ncbi:AAA family ATPase, partial [Oculatella sp. LEGE 06141]|uniref:DNA repair protein RecN n=1 Tax=Oculatella sp. LEGE 06141 TaxID=1828648 RepID=UPI00187DE723
MLTSLQIENFALVDHLELELGQGLNVLTGETGAGKSIILDALDAALGGKMTSRAIRTGAERSSVEATFDLDPALIAWLSEQEIELVDDMTLVCSRELTASRGNVRSRSRVNGVLVNKQQMESLRDRLVEITAQGQTVLLGQTTLQREWLDGLGGRKLVQQREKVAIAHSTCQQALQALEKRRQFEQQRLQQLDLFEYQAKELSAANLSDPNELDQLEQERQRLSHSVELQQQSYQVYQALYQNDSGAEACADLLGKAESILADMARYDHQIQAIAELVGGALAQVEEAGRQINAYGEDLETDPDRLQTVEERIVELKQICRKYGPTLSEAIAHNQRVQTELEELSDSGQSLEVLEETYQLRQAELKEQCATLTSLRQAAARQLEALLLNELKPLAMEKVQFQVDIAPATPTATGADRVTFLFSP